MLVYKNIIDEVFSSTYDVEKYRRFSKEFFKEIDLKPTRKSTAIWKEFSNHIISFSEHGIFEYKGSRVSVLSVELDNIEMIKKSRSVQRNFVSKFLDNNGYDAALIAFYSDNNIDWRLSFIRLDYSLTENGVLKKLTPSRRSSYLLGVNEPNHTAKKQLLSILLKEQPPTIDEIEDAFSVERVTNEFFEKYKEKYLDLKEHLDQNEAFIRVAQEKNFTSEEFAKKLLGQIAFLYFLQKKGWLGVQTIPATTISADELNEIYKKMNSEEARDVLTRAFVKVSDNSYRRNAEAIVNFKDEEGELLAQAFQGTSFSKPFGKGEKRFIRTLFERKKDRNFFNDFLEPLFYNALNKKRGITQYYTYFNCRIPFLNGGLFEPLEGYDWENTDFKIPDELFSNKTEDEEGTGILDVFDLFNFTMNEAEPLDKEVAIDPEMLGKIFERLLDVKDRKSKGAFYTPREVVHYICQEVLINYLHNNTKIDTIDLEKLIRFGELIRDEDNSRKLDNEKLALPQIILDNLNVLDILLESVKVADPAVGSGAFPLGMLNELVKARMTLTDYLIKETSDHNEIEHIQRSRTPYKLKMHAMKYNIFAVDIEHSATDITKLRLWLSLIVDEKIDTINPLPNLDYNIRTGNSLIEDYDGIKLFDEKIFEGKGKKIKDTQMGLFNSYEEEAIEHLYNLQQMLFSEHDKNKKEEIKREVEKTEWEIIEYKLKSEGNENSFKQLQRYKKERTKPYFLWKLEFAKIFREKKGFDIVIGNPPYVDSEEMVRNLSKLREDCNRIYKSAKGNWDLFIVFIEQGMNLLNNLGTISYIVPNKLVSAKYSEKLREIILTKSIKEFRDYSSVRVFKDADVYPVVFHIDNTKKQEKVRMTVMKSLEKISSSLTIEPNLFYSDIYWDKYYVDNPKLIDIITKMSLSPTLETYANVLGAATVGEAYLIKEKLKELQEIDINQNFKKLINTGTIDPYESLWGIKNTTYIKGSYHKPVILEKDLYEISSTRLEQAIEQKIIVGGMTKCLECYFDNSGGYLAGKSTTIIFNSDIDLKYILAILNSKLMTFYFKIYFNSLSLAGGYLRIGPPQLKKLPIKEPNESYGKVIELVNKVLEISEEDNKKEMIDNIENEIYKIYNLSDEEISLVENYLFPKTIN